MKNKSSEGGNDKKAGYAGIKQTHLQNGKKVASTDGIPPRTDEAYPNVGIGSVAGRKKGQ